MSKSLTTPKRATECFVRLGGEIQFRISAVYPLLPQKFVVSAEVREDQTLIFVDQTLLGMVAEELAQPVLAEITFAGVKITDDGSAIVNYYKLISCKL